MPNQSNIPGNQNIIIQEISNSSITLVINGEMQEIRNELSDLKRLMRELQLLSVQYAEKNYPVESLNEDNFNFLVGKKAFNEKLTKTLIEAIAPYSNAARDLLNTTSNTKAWESEDRFSDKAKQIISCSFVGVIGIQLSKLVAIGKEDLKDSKQRDYIEKCIDIAKYSLDLLSITLLSKLWDEHRLSARNFSDKEIKAINAFFDGIVEQSLLERYNFLQILDGIFANRDNHIVCPIPEWSGFSEMLKNDTAFYHACQTLTKLNERLEKKLYNLIDCFEAEATLCVFLQNISFLANYSMASIHQISYRQLRNCTPQYLHNYFALGIDNKSNADKKKINYTPETVHTNAILLYRGEHYNDYINLTPFVIDYNALVFEDKAKICFYYCKNFDGDSLEYIFPENKDRIHIEKNGVSKSVNMNEIMSKKEKQVELNIDSVFELFQEARECFLGSK